MMALRARVGVFVLWLVSLVAVGVLASTQARPSAEPQVLSGNDLGFRLDGSQANGPRGTLVVRINGKWVDAQFAVKPNRVTTGE
jgi:hypothetical protein